MDQLKWHVGDVVRKLRESKRWNQARLAEVSGVNKGTIVSVEENGNVKRETLEKVAAGLGMSVGDVYNLIPGSETQRSAAAAELIPPATADAVGGTFRERRTTVGGGPVGGERRRAADR